MDSIQEHLSDGAEPPADVALLVLEAGLRTGEAPGLKWADVVLDPLAGLRLG